MKYRKLSETGDYTFGNGFANFHIDNVNAVQQSVLTRLRLWAKEWFLDLTEGTQYPAEALGKYTTETIDPMIKERILNTEGVVQILEYNGIFDNDLRNYKINVTIETIFGTVILDEVL